MRKLAFLLLPLLLVAAAPAPRVSGEEAAKVDWAARRGALLSDVDRAAWVTTDDMIARLGDEERDVPVKGWVVEREGSAPGAFVVTYFGDGPSGRVALYAGHVRDRKIVSGEVFPDEARPKLTALQARIADAVTLARAQTRFQPCTSARFNATAIPPETPDGPVDVYLLTAMTEKAVFPMGGHFLVRVGPDGKIVSTRPFTKSCLNMSQPPAGAGSEPEAMVVTDLLDPTPTEIHVFMSILLGKPIFVVTGHGRKPRVWAVAGPAIQAVQ